MAGYTPSLQWYPGACTHLCLGPNGSVEEGAVAVQVRTFPHSKHSRCRCRMGRFHSFLDLFPEDRCYRPLDQNCCSCASLVFAAALTYGVRDTVAAT